MLVRRFVLAFLFLLNLRFPDSLVALFFRKGNWLWFLAIRGIDFLFACFGFFPGML